MAKKKGSGSKSGSDDELKTFRAEFHRLIGGAIVCGLVKPKIVGTIDDITISGDGPLEKDYDQDTGNYTQLSGDHEQNSGNYDQQ